MFPGNWPADKRRPVCADERRFFSVKICGIQSAEICRFIYLQISQILLPVSRKDVLSAYRHILFNTRIYGSDRLSGPTLEKAKKCSYGKLQLNL
jgi:hypothetical protein